MQARGVLLIALMGVAPSTIAARYIVKFNRDSVMRQVSYDLQKAQEKTRSENNFLALPSQTRAYDFLGVKATSTKTLSALSMMEVELQGDAQAKQLEAHPEVAYVEEEIFYNTPAFAPLDDNSAEITWGLQGVDAVNAWSQGATGQGARVLVLDTGIDRNHPDLRENFIEGKSFVHQSVQDIAFKSISSPMNFLFDAFAEEQPAADYLYFDDVGHGTHVSGTIAAGHNGFGVAGVAPNAKLLAGKVCSRLGCSSLAIINGLNWAIETQVDVVNMSLGGPVPSRSQMEAAQRVDEANILVVAASGNDGEFEKNRISFPAGYPTVFSVGAITPQFERAPFSQYGPDLDIVAPGTEVDSTVPVGTGRSSKVEIIFNGEVQRVNSSSFAGSEENEIPLNGEFVAAGLGLETDFLDAAKFAGKMALVQRGQITFADKVHNALAVGAIGVIIYNNTTGLISGSITTDGSSVGIPVAMIEKHVGEAIINALNQGHIIEADVSIERTDYAGLAGTSMASPHVAGVAALVRAANPSLSTSQVRELLRSTATPMNAMVLDNEYGSGVVNAATAVRSVFNLNLNLVTQD